MRDYIIQKIHCKDSNKRNFFFAFFVVLIVILVIGMMAYNKNEVYDNEKEFRTYVDSQLEINKTFETTTSDNTKYYYGETNSYAINYAKCTDEKLSVFMDNEIEQIKQKYKDDASADENIKALIVSSGIYKSKNGVISLVIHERRNVKNSKEMLAEQTSAHIYNFSKKTGELLVPEQVFTPEYREFCAEYFKDYFQTNYEADELIKGWQKNLLPDENNYDKYILTDAGAAFVFDEGTILDKSNGVLCVGIPSAKFKRFIRKEIIERYIDPARPMVAITYDDGPGGESEDRILSCLESNNSVATFFYQGYRIAGNESKIARARDIGCEIGNHTWNHPVLTSTNADELSVQINNTNAAIYSACNQYPTVFRPSYGITNNAINQASGLPVIFWSVDTLDWKTKDGQKVFDYIKGCGNLDGKIVLMHSIHDSTADATEMMVPWLKEQGYQLVTVSELIKYKTGADPVPGQTYR